MANKLISVIVPSYNHSRFLRSTLASIVSQTYRPLEIVIVDDGSTDDSPEIIRTFQKEHSTRGNLRIKAIFQPNRGAHEAINHGIRSARGEIVTILNSDDLFHPQRLELLSKPVLEKKTELAMSLVDFIDESSNPIPATDPRCDWYFPKISLRYLVPSPSLAMFLWPLQVTSGNLLFSRKLFDKVGGFRNYHWCHDYDFALRATLWTEPVFVSKNLISYRYHGTNTVTSMHRESARFNHEVRRILEDYLEEAVSVYEQRKSELNQYTALPFTWPFHFKNFYYGACPFFSGMTFSKTLSLCIPAIVPHSPARRKELEVTDRLRPFLREPTDAPEVLQSMSELRFVHRENFSPTRQPGMERFSTPRFSRIKFDNRQLGFLIETEAKISPKYNDRLLLAAAFREGRLHAVLRFHKSVGKKKLFRGFCPAEPTFKSPQDLEICWLDFSGTELIAKFPEKKVRKVPPLRGKVKAQGYIDTIQNYTDHTIIEGWALIDGQVPEQIELSVGQKQIKMLPVLYPRSDLVPHLADSESYQFAGFRFAVPQIKFGSKGRIKLKIRYRNKTFNLLPRSTVTRVEI